MAEGDVSNPPSPGTPHSDASVQLTPKRKVQALLAQFGDSDTDTDTDLALDIKSSATRRPDETTRNAVSNPDDDDDSENDQLPRGRVANRLLGNSSSYQSHENGEVPANNSEDYTITSTAREAADVQPSDDEDEEIVTAESRRRGLAEEREPSDSGRKRLQTPTARSASPLFFSSPGSSPRSPASQISELRRSTSPTTVPEHGRSKFLALVDKHRKERMAREAAEAAKRAVHFEESGQRDTPGRRAPRGSSPADDSEEDEGSDDGAAQRISKQARPTRKASKKAIEEMNRETQRMNRNMQLAHQAKTKKRFTKEGFLARFNLIPAGELMQQQQMKDKSTEVSSATNSDTDNANRLETPPTSPLHEPEAEPTKKMSQMFTTSFEMSGALAARSDLTEIKDFKALGNLGRGQQLVQDYIRSNRTVFSPEAEDLDIHVNLTDIASGLDLTTKSENVRSRFRPSKAALKDQSDSEGEIEIVRDNGSWRKYAAFETLPRRKAKETPSHLALRSLANLMGHDDKQKSINTAQMEASLRRRARLQALEERKQKIEELKAKGIFIQTSEERDREQQEVEDLVERARQEAAEIQKREREMAKKDGTYVKDHLDDDDDESDDEDFEDDAEENERDSGSESEDDLQRDDVVDRGERLVDDEVDEADSEGSDPDDAETEVDEADSADGERMHKPLHVSSKTSRKPRVISDDEDEGDNNHEDKENTTPRSLRPDKTPQSVLRSSRKVIPGLQMSDDLPMGLSQAFAATMAECQDDERPIATQDEDSYDIIASLPSPNLAPMMPLQRLDSIDIISDSQPATQTQPLNVNLELSYSQAVPESPSVGLGNSVAQFTPSQRPFELTQDAGYLLSPFSGSRFADTPSRHAPQSTIDTLILPANTEDSPKMVRRGKLRRGRAAEETEVATPEEETAFQVMKRAATKKAIQTTFDKSKSEARQHFDEAAEESEDEYAGLGGASDEDVDDEENEEDRRMIDEDTQVGVGDEAKLAGFYADRERERDEKDVSKLLKDITTGALRRKRGMGDDLDLSDEEDAVARRREAKRREFARMRRELLKDEAVGKIAEDKKKEAFLRSIEDREEADEDNEEDDSGTEETPDDSQSQRQTLDADIVVANSQEDPHTEPKSKQPLNVVAQSKMNRLSAPRRRTTTNLTRKPSNLAEIRQSVSFLIEEPDSQAAVVDLGLSDSEDEPEAWVDLDRHLREAENDENILNNDDDAEDLGDFIVDDDKDSLQDFKKPELPSKDRAPFSERRTKRDNVVDRLSLMRQTSSSSSGSSASSKMAFFSSRTGSSSMNGVPSLLRRATTNSSLGSMSGRENVSATGVSTNNGVGSRTERGDATSEKEFIRKGSSGRRNAVNFQARTTLKEEKMSQRAGIVKASAKNKRKGGNGFLNGLFRGDSWS